MAKGGKQFTIRIPTRTYLRKFLAFELNEEVMTCPGPHPVQNFFQVLLEKKFYKYSFTGFDERYQDTITAVVSEWTFSHIGGSISKTNVVMFNNYLESLFDSALYRHTQEYFNNYFTVTRTFQELHESDIIYLKRDQRRRWIQSPKYKDALHKFAEAIGMEIEVDISYENLKKMEWRARKRLEKDKKTLLQTVPAIRDNNFSIEFERPAATLYKQISIFGD